MFFLEFRKLSHFRVTIRKVKVWNDDFGFLIPCVWEVVFEALRTPTWPLPFSFSFLSVLLHLQQTTKHQSNIHVSHFGSSQLLYVFQEGNGMSEELRSVITGCVWGAFQTALWVGGLRTDYLLLRFNGLQLGWGRESLCLENTNCWRPVVLVTHHLIRRNTSPNITKPLTLSWTFRSVLFNTLIPLSWWKSGF